MSKKLTTEEFILKSREKHGDKYDYSKVNYKKAIVKITIICPEHGEFEQKSNDHFKGRGCPKCGGNIKSTTEEFILKARKIHGDRYDYSKVEYKKAIVKITIICPEHGEFEQIPANHLTGKHCPKCANTSRGEKSKLSNDEFILKAREVHGDRYDYSKVEYKKAIVKITIICPEHGEFEQTPNSHLRGSGCAKCIGRNKTTEEFILKSCEIHGNKYDYSKVNYVYAKTKVTIICPEHGEFEQIPSGHLTGSGCSKCIGKGFSYLSFTEAREFVRKLNLKSQKEYREWWDNNKEYCQEIGLSKTPDRIYKNK